LVAIYASPTTAYVDVAHSLGNGDFHWVFGTTVSGNFTAARALPGQFDGSYGADNVWARVDGDSVRLNVLLAKETNDNLAPTSTAVTEGPTADNLDVLVADLNGDGRDDVIVNDRSTNKSWIALADPNGVLKFGSGWQQHPSTYVSWSNFETLTGDVDGDGRDDVIWVHPASPARIYVGLGN
ncbi:MAG: FG-GAP-like repeat-containing protein, partial [Gemmatimonadota bacterium]